MKKLLLTLLFVLSFTLASAQTEFVRIYTNICTIEKDKTPEWKSAENKFIFNYKEDTILKIVFTPLIGTHSVTHSRDFNFNTDYSFQELFNLNNNIDKINKIEESGIVFADGTKQTSCAGVIPQNWKSEEYNYSLQLSDIGKHIYMNTKYDYNNVFIPNENIPFPIGTTIVVVSGDSWTFIRPADYHTKLWGAGFNSTSYYFYIPNNSMATLLKIGINKWMVSGAGLGNDD